MCYTAEFNDYTVITSVRNDAIKFSIASKFLSVGRCESIIRGYKHRYHVGKNSHAGSLLSLGIEVSTISKASVNNNGLPRLLIIKMRS